MVHVDVVFLHRGRAKPSTLILGGTLVRTVYRLKTGTEVQQTGRRLVLTLIIGGCRCASSTTLLYTEHCTPYSLTLTQSNTTRTTQIVTQSRIVLI